jgi:predicted O-methyltransferase YrrM
MVGRSGMGGHEMRDALMFHGRNLVARWAGYFGSEKANYPRFVAVDTANGKTVSFVRSTGARMIAEIGIYHGHTSLEFAKYLNGAGELHLFDYADRVETVRQQLAAAGFNNVKTFGSSYKLLDSYNWCLAKLIEQHGGPIYDYIFLDGAHTFAIDALTFFLADKLLEVGGHIDFDDYHWTLGSSPALRPERFPLTGKMFTREQIDAEQVQMIVELLVRRSGRYDEVVENKIFRKLC